MILTIYKEKGWTSFDVVAKIRGILKARYGRKNVKVGHAGTLDPLAEGVLVVLTEEDTKNQDAFMAYDKEYLAVIGLGASSETYDSESTFIYSPIPADFDIELALKQVLPKFLGLIQQKVPPYSAVKVAGRPLYKNARKGKTKEEDIPIKKIEIKNIEVTKIEAKPKLFEITAIITCGKGTYIRSLAHDLGKELGIGGVLLSLLRTRIGPYRVEDSYRISEWEKTLELEV